MILRTSPSVKKQRYTKRDCQAFLYLLPWLIGILALQLYPFLSSLVYSFHDYTVGGKMDFVGIDNYVKLFTKDRDFWNSLKVTLLFGVYTVPGKLILALAVAMFLNRNIKGINMIRTLYYIPSLFGGSVAISLLWRLMFMDGGMVNSMLSALGLNTVHFLGTKGTAMQVVCGLEIWQFGSSMLIFLSALKQIPRELSEAAHVDGANGVQKFFKVTLPLLTPTVFFNLVQQTINSFLAFTQCKLITNGDPRKSTLFYTVYQYNKAFPAVGKSQMGYASALAWIMLVLISLVTALLFWSKSKWVYDD